MKRVIICAVIAFCFLVCGKAMAAAPSAWDVLVTPATPYETDITFGSTLGFNYWFNAAVTPQGQTWDVFYLQEETGGWTTLRQWPFSGSSTSWQTASLSVPLALQGDTRTVRFSVRDYANVTNPEVYLRNIPGSTASPVPEPATMSLLGIGILGLFFGLRKKA